VSTETCGPRGGDATIRRVWRFTRQNGTERVMNSIIYLVGLVVIVIAVLSFFGLR
jgi:hypothetical protein